MRLIKTHLSAKPRPWSHPLVSFILLCFLSLSLFCWIYPDQMPLFTASRDEIFKEHQFWRLFTTIAVHGDLRHFLSNSLFFWIFGFLLHSYFDFLVFPVLSLVFGAVTNALTLYYYPGPSILIGASGVVYFMVGFWATAYFFIERKAHPLQRIVAALGVTLVLFFPTSYEPETSYLAHFIGFVLGTGVGTVYFFLNRSKIRKAEIWKVEEVLIQDENSQLSPHLDRLHDPVDDPSE